MHPFTDACRSSITDNRWEYPDFEMSEPDMQPDDYFEEAWLRGPTGIEFYTRTYVPSSTAKAVLVFAHGFIGM